jgi:membrane-bound lytic murein transglycosylase B
MTWAQTVRAVFICAVALAAAPAAAQTSDFQTFVRELRQEARGKGISDGTLDAAFESIQPIQRVIELDRKQPEFTMTFDEYLGKTVSAARVAKGRDLYRQHRELLERVGRDFGVQPRFILALWGMETDFGRLTGGFQVIPALATLAWEGRRAAFFRTELLNALKICDQEHMAPSKMIGSWAGAMGQPQFMPSSYLKFARDYDGDGRRDIWTSLPDVFASAANYLASSGWQNDQTWGREVKLPAAFNTALIGPNTSKSLGEWARLGVRRSDGGALPPGTIKASLVRPEGGPAFLVYDNWRVVMKWNRSTFYALAVGHLADLIGNR